MNIQSIQSRYDAFVGVSYVCVCVGLIVVLAMLASFAQRVVDPVSHPEYVSLKTELMTDPSNDTLRVAIRDLDASLRADYFRRRYFNRLGGWLLLGTVVIGLSSAKIASSLRRRLPDLSQASITTESPEARMSRHSLSAVGGFAAGVFLVGLLMAASDQSLLPNKASELAALNPHSTLADSSERPSATREPTAPSPLDIAPPPEVKYPTAEQLARHWPRFRGPSGDGVALLESELPPFDADNGSGVLWKTPIPLPGKNSVIRWGDQLFVSGADADRQEVYCLDAKTGERRWTYSLPALEPPRESPKVNDDTGYAASTMATNGHQVIAIFATGQLVALKLDGSLAWNRDFGELKNQYGHASSLIVDADRVICQIDQGSKTDQLAKLVALSAATGDEVWSVTRAVPASWSTPLVVSHEGQSQVITCADPWVIAYACDSGEELWRSKSLRQDVGPSPISQAGIVYVANEYPGASAIRLGGRGDVTESHVAWTVDLSIPDTASPVIVGDLILMMTSYGTLACYDHTEGGDPLWEEDFDDNFQASPTRWEDKVLLIGESGRCWNIRPTREACEVIHESNLGEECVTSPAFDAKRMYIRGAEHVIAIGES